MSFASEDSDSSSDLEFTRTKTGKNSSKKGKRKLQSLPPIEDENLVKEQTSKQSEILDESGTNTDNYSAYSELNDDITGGEKGSLVYIFRGQENDPNEVVVFSKLCEKFGLQSWDEMMRFLPWRDRASLRTALCHVIMKQALSEYDGIRANPLIIREDNKRLCKDNPDYTLKGGTFVNQQWGRTPEDWAAIRQQNYEKYHISDEEAEKIEIPSIISIEYMKQLCSNRRQSLLLRRAALRMELAKRRALKKAQDEGRDPSTATIPQEERDWGVDDLPINDPSCLDIPKYQNNLKAQKNATQYYVDLDELDANEDSQ